MIADRRVLAVITARGGSKGLPGKNVRELAGLPLLAWTIRAAHGSELIDRSILSTDDEAIAETARAHGCDVPFLREPRLALDETPSVDVVLDALDRVPGYDIVVLLQPTSPLRTSEDIDAALRLCLERDAPGCVSVCEAAESPYWMYTLDAAQRMIPLMPEGSRATRRQDLPSVHVLNGAVYVVRSEVLRREGAFVVPGVVGYRMPRERSVDIDTEADFLEAERYLHGMLQ